MSEQRSFEPTITRGYVSERGPFKINENPAINTPTLSDKLNEDHVAKAFDYSVMAEKYGEDTVQGESSRNGQVLL